MRRADRLFRIVHLLRRDRATTAGQIARELEVSERTVYRDVQDLMQSGVPIQGEAGVGYALPAHFDLPPLMFTRVELQALVLGARMVSAFADEDLGRAARSAIDKVERAVPQRLAGDASAGRLFVPEFLPTADLPRMAALRAAVEGRGVTRIDYADERGEVSSRDVRPLGLWFWGKVWTLLAWCELRQDFRSFRVDRVRAVAEVGRPFRDEPGKSLEDFLQRMGCEGEEPRPRAKDTAKAKERTLRAKSGAPTDPDVRAAWSAFLQLPSVGPATADDLVRLGFRRVEELRGQDPRELYERMCVLTACRQDPCVEDVFRCVIAQAETPDLPEPLKQWYRWTPLRGQPPSARPKELLPTRRRSTK